MTSSKKTFSLSLKKEWEPTDRLCVVSRCKAEADLLDSTRRFGDADLPLCTAHWIQASDCWHEAKRVVGVTIKLYGLKRKDYRSLCRLLGVEHNGDKLKMKRRLKKAMREVMHV